MDFFPTQNSKRVRACVPFRWFVLNSASLAFSFSLSTFFFSAAASFSAFLRASSCSLASRFFFCSSVSVSSDSELELFDSFAFLPLPPDVFPSLPLFPDFAFFLLEVDCLLVLAPLGFLPFFLACQVKVALTCDTRMVQESNVIQWSDIYPIFRSIFFDR